ncbi:MAG: SIMPL domain-containing protein [Actinomycetota bacterium]
MALLPARRGGGDAAAVAPPGVSHVTVSPARVANTAQGALQQNADRMTKVFAALAALGITKDDLATSNVSLWPVYGNSGTDITGYQASNQVDVTVHDVTKAGEVIDAGVDAGANLTNGISFTMSEDNPALDRALADAVRDARGKAEIMASAGDASLGQVVTIVESRRPVYPPIYYGGTWRWRKPAPRRRRGPTLESQVSVTVTWELA